MMGNKMQDAGCKMQDLKLDTCNLQLDKDAIQEAIDFGIDITLLYERLLWTPTERIEKHQLMLEFADELRKAGERKHGKG